MRVISAGFHLRLFFFLSLITLTLTNLLKIRWEWANWILTTLKTELWVPTLQTKNKSNNNCKVIYIKAKTWQSQLYFNASLTFWNKINA